MKKEKRARNISGAAVFLAIFQKETVNLRKKHKKLQGGLPAFGGIVPAFSQFCPGRSMCNGACGERFRTGLFPSAGPFIGFFMDNTPKPVMGRYARIIMDRWFKRTFLLQKDSLRLLQLFLQEVIPEHDIVEIRTDNIEHVNILDDNKDVRVDVECYDKDGTRFVCEVQVAPQHHFYERAVYNSSLAIQKQKRAGESDYDFPTVYFIGLMDFSMHKGSDRVDFRYDLRERSSGELMTPRLQYVFLELPNALSRALTPEASILDNICFALHEMEHLTERPAELKQEIFRLLFNSAELTNFTPDERAKYQLDMTTERDIYNQIAYARDEGLEEGIEIGMEKGMEKGSRQKALETARALLRLGVAMEIITQATGLSVEELQALAV